jgi:hypothetical protein
MELRHLTGFMRRYGASMPERTRGGIQKRMRVSLVCVTIPWGCLKLLETQCAFTRRMTCIQHVLVIDVRTQGGLERPKHTVVPIRRSKCPPHLPTHAGGVDQGVLLAQLALELPEDTRALAEQAHAAYAQAVAHVATDAALSRATGLSVYWPNPTAAYQVREVPTAELHPRGRLNAAWL